MTAFNRSPFPAATLLAGAALALLAGCSDSAKEDADNAISIVGSSTVHPFAQKVAEDYVKGAKGALAPVITQTGTSEGIKEFCVGTGAETPDIVNASRRMTFGEFNRCSNNGVSDIIEIKVGRDGIAFVSSIKDGIELKLTPQIVYKALAANPFGEKQQAKNWSDVDPSLPGEPIVVYGPPTTSGTRDALLEVIMLPPCRANPAMASLEIKDPQEFARDCNALRAGPAYLDQGEEDDLIVRKVANNPRAVGIFGYSYLEKNKDKVKGLPLGGVLPTAETIADGTYPASRPLYIYVKKANIDVTPGIREYLAQWAKSWGVGGVLAKIGMIPATEEQQKASAAAIKNLTALKGEDLQTEPSEKEAEAVNAAAE
jgi:phosphate transport system substrate-binding protein